MRPRLGFTGLLLAITFLLLGDAAQAQNVSGRISGLVTDPSGGSIPGAQITILKRRHRRFRQGIATCSAFYLATRLIPGPYSVTAEAKGVEQFTKTNKVGEGKCLALTDHALQALR